MRPDGAAPLRRGVDAAPGRGGERGFAMLAALLVAVIAAVFAGVALAAATSALQVAADDGGRARARATAEAGTDLAIHRLRWALLRPGASLTCRIGDGDGQSEAADVRTELTAQIIADPGLPSYAVRITSAARCGRATTVARSVVALVPAALPLGLSVAEDADVQAPLDVSGSGVYVGGALRGRERVSFVTPGLTAPGVGAPPDVVHGGRWPVAGVHAGAGIWAAGAEVHDLAPVPEAYAADTDPHTGAEADHGDEPAGPVPAAWVEPPDAAWLAAARLHALTPAAALAGGVLRLDRLPPALASGEPGARELAGFADPASGYLVVVSSRGMDGGLVVTGRRDPAWAPVTVVVEGDAVLAGRIPTAVAAQDAGSQGTSAAEASGDGSVVTFRGALVVTGHLEVAATTSLAGHLACRRLVVAAPLSVSVPPDWREAPPLGSLRPVLLARD